MTAQVHERITIEADKMDGQPCIRGLRFPVVTVLRMDITRPTFVMKGWPALPTIRCLLRQEPASSS